MSRSEVQESLILMGKCLKGHGIRGEIKVLPETDEPSHFEGLERVYVGTSEASVTAYEVEHVRYQHTSRGLLVLLKLRGVTDRTTADTLRGSWVFAEEAELPPLEEGEYYLHDLVGMEAELESGELIGTVVDVMELPAHDVLVIRREEGQEVLVPLVPELVPNVDLEKRRVRIHPIEGLLEP